MNKKIENENLKTHQKGIEFKFEVHYLDQKIKKKEDEGYNC